MHLFCVWIGAAHVFFREKCLEHRQSGDFNYFPALLMEVAYVLSHPLQLPPTLENRLFRPRLGFLSLCGEADSRYIGCSVAFFSRHLK